MDLQTTYLLLEKNGDAVELPITDDFWDQLMSGNPTNAAAKRLMQSDGRMVSAYAMNADWTSWEMHPAGDEVLILLKGKMTLVLEEGSAEKLIKLTAGKAAIVPKGVWHTAKMSAPIVLLAITAGAGTLHRPA
jgi:mannose-6-phosphate isomerase-like protein (cupin superfamily)